MSKQSDLQGGVVADSAESAFIFNPPPSYGDE